MYNSLAVELEKLIKSDIAAKDGVKGKFKKRLKEVKLTRDENPISHFVCSFYAYDPQAKKVYIGNHKESDLWLSSGGHIEKGETSKDALKREIDEEWGINLDVSIPPMFLTITEIDNERQKCKRHYDIWYFLPVDKNKFKPKPELEAKEFYQTKWLSIAAAKELIICPSMLEALDYIEKELF